MIIPFLNLYFSSFYLLNLGVNTLKKLKPPNGGRGVRKPYQLK